MSESAYATPERDFDDYGGGQNDSDLPGRPRRQFLNRWSAAAIALLLGAIGFYVGVRVEKSHVSGGSTGAASALAARVAGATGATDRGTGSTRTGSFAFPRGGAGGFTGAFGGGNAAVGTVSSVDGDTIYVKETDGNTVKVKLSRATTITKSMTVSRGKLYPGDTVVVAGAKGSGASLTATSITDSGASSSSSTGSTGSGSTGSGSSSSSSVVGSLFGS